MMKNHSMRFAPAIAAVVAGLALLTAACGNGSDGDSSSGSSDGPRIVEVAMVDIDYKPETLSVAKGEEIRFVFTNEGKVRHEAYFGSANDQADHEKEMVEGGKDSGGHNAHGGDTGSKKVEVEPDKTADVTYRFEEVGAFEIGCHEPGHYAGGMKITIDVA